MVSLKTKILFLILFFILFGLVKEAFAAVLFQMDWEGSSITDSPQGFEDMDSYYDNATPANNMTQATSSCFDGSKCLQIDWKVNTNIGCPGVGEVACAREVYLDTPSIMGSTHEYYVGFAVKFPAEWRNVSGRKILYRTGNDAESVLFQGTKGKACGQSAENGHIYLKNPGNLGGGTEDDPWNQIHSEKNGVGGPLCQSYTADSCINWPTAQGYPFVASDGQWHKVIYYTKEDLLEGVQTLWIDGVKVIHIDKNAWNDTASRVGGPCVQTFYNSAHADFTGFKFPTYFNFGPPADQTEYWDNFIVATTLEEVQSYLLDETAPSAPTGLSVQ